MKFGFNRKGESKSKQVSNQKEPDSDSEAIREAILKATSATAERRTAPQGFPEGSRQMGILLLPETSDVMEFWTLYKKIEQSGLQNHVAIFAKSNGKWTEESLPDQ